MQDNWQLTLARVGIAGKSPYAPGTVGSLAAIVSAPFVFMPLPFFGRVLMLLFLFWIGTHASTKAEELLGKEDPSEVVIDEVLGQWITCLPFVALSFWQYVGAFLLFRFFDITKVWPIRCAEQMPKGLGIMLDDAVAGVYAMLCLVLFSWLF